MELPTKIERVKIDSLHPYPGNSRQGDIPKIRESLRTNGQFRPLLVQKSSRNVVFGNQTMRAAVEEGWTEIAVVIADLTDDEAERINIVDNRTSDLAHDDESILLPRLEKFGPHLDGTGFAPLDVAAMKERLAPLGPPPGKTPGPPLIGGKVGTVTFTLSGDEWTDLQSDLEAATGGKDPVLWGTECKARLLQ